MKIHKVTLDLLKFLCDVQDKDEHYWDEKMISSFLSKKYTGGVVLTNQQKVVAFILFRKFPEKRLISIEKICISGSMEFLEILITYLAGRFKKSNFRAGKFRSIICIIPEFNCNLFKLLMDFGFMPSARHVNYFKFGDEICFYMTAQMFCERIL